MCSLVHYASETPRNLPVKNRFSWEPLFTQGNGINTFKYFLQEVAWLPVPFYANQGLPMGCWQSLGTSGEAQNFKGNTHHLTRVSFVEFQGLGVKGCFLQATVKIVLNFGANLCRAKKKHPMAP